MRIDVRPPAVAGHFYPADPDRLRALIDELLAAVPRERRRCRAVVVPHAGLVYSGACAAAVFGRLAPVSTVVILAPNHSGCCESPGASLWDRGAFATPLGTVPIDASFAAALMQRSHLACHDPVAHRVEHAIEVELPFLQVVMPSASIVPIVVAWDDWPRTRDFAESLAACVAARTDVLVVASSDMTHYEPAAAAARKDRAALEVMARLDGAGLLDVCRRGHITMCGRVPAAVAIEAARRLGAAGADVVDYRHSGMVSGEEERVVGYAGVMFS